MKSGVVLGILTLNEDNKGLDMWEVGPDKGIKKGGKIQTEFLLKSTLTYKKDHYSYTE